MAVFDTFRLDGKSALVTGGSKGLGRAMALALSEAGANVVICSRNLEEAQTAAGDITRETGRPAFGFRADVIDRASLRQLAQHCEDAVGTHRYSGEQRRDQYPQAHAGSDAKTIGTRWWTSASKARFCVRKRSCRE